jgi:anti-sigma28 factor (negative regulator of flagellin synthesis)
MGGVNPTRGAAMALKPINPALVGKPLADRYQPAGSSSQPAEAGPKNLANHQPPPSLADQAEISSQARKMVDLRHIIDAARREIEQTPDVRADRVARAKERIASGFYQSATVRDQVATRLNHLLLDSDLF